MRPVELVLVAAMIAAGCSAPRPPEPPSIAFEVVPDAAAGGSDRTAPISGRVTGARAGQQIVLYARSGVWWVQPLTAQPFTRIEEDSTWKNRTHLGTEYAALLVEPGYRPAHTTDALPAPGAGVIAVASVKGTSAADAAPPNVLSFSGYDWEVRASPSDRGGANDYDPANAWVDADGFLHLKLTRRDGRWTSAEVALTRTLGYGTYVFTVKDVTGMDPASTLGLFTWDDQSAEQNHREMDIEISQWGDASTSNAQYVVQPYYVPANVARFAAPAGTLTHAIRWEPGRASFTTVRGTRPDGTPVAQHAFTSGVPAPGSERVRMNLYFFRFSPVALQNDVEVVIERFQYLP